MMVSLNWLTDYVDISLPATELGELLTQIGLNLEGIVETDTDIVLDLEVTSNRSDCLGHLGVAREIAAATGAEFRMPEIPELPTTGVAADYTSVEVQCPDLCPRYTARLIRGVKVGPSPEWLIERLEAIGMRSVNNIVDVTNYVLMEYSQPLHSFDHDKLAGGRIVVRRGLSGEVMTSIDETKCHLDENMCVIADAKKAVAVAGIMGGLDSEVTESTTNVLIEAAQFDPLNTRHTSRKLQLMSESNYRFERGIDPVGLERASLRACQLILELAGGELAGGMVDIWADPWQGRTVTLRPARCNALLGMDVQADEQAAILTRLGLTAKLDGETITCQIPPNRADLTREADLIEEVARLAGYNNIPISDKVTHTLTAETLETRTRRTVAEAMTAAGFDEAVTNTFIDAEEAKLFGWNRCVTVDPSNRKTNNALRPTVLPNLLRACKTNQDAGNRDVHLFELAGVFEPGKDGGLPAEHVELGIVSLGELSQLRGALEALIERIAPQAKLDVRSASVAGFAEDAAAKIMLDGEKIGKIGMIDPTVLDHYDLSSDRQVAAAVVCFEAILAKAGRGRTYQGMPKFPAIQRDLSVIVDGEVTWQNLTDAVAQIDQPMRQATDYVTTYTGKQIGQGRKSVTFQLTYRSDETTLRSEQVDAEVDEIISALKKKFAAELRA